MMKTRLVILAVLFAFACNSANAQFLNLADNNQRITFGVQLGEAGWQTNYPGFGWGISASICGVYLDFLLSPPQHKNDHHVNQSRPLDDEAFAINVGYQIPLFSWLRIAPIVGYSQTNYGYTDMSSVHIHVDEGSHSGSIYHDYFPQERFHDFNFGGGLFIQPIKYLELYGVYTRRAVYGGISFNLTALSEKLGSEK